MTKAVSFVAVIIIILGLWALGQSNLDTRSSQAVHSPVHNVEDILCTPSGDPVIIKGFYGPTKSPDPFYDVWDGTTIGLVLESTLSPCIYNHL